MCVHDLKGVACLQVLAVSGFPCLFWFLCNHHYDASHTFKAGISCSSGMCVSRVNQTGPPSAVVSASDCGLEGGVRIPSVMWDFSALAGSYPELGVLWAQWEGWNHTAELHPLHGCVFEGVALIT